MLRLKGARNYNNLYLLLNVAWVPGTVQSYLHTLSFNLHNKSMRPSWQPFFKRGSLGEVGLATSGKVTCQDENMSVQLQIAMNYAVSSRWMYKIPTLPCRVSWRHRQVSQEASTNSSNRQSSIARTTPTSSEKLREGGNYTLEWAEKASERSGGLS